MGLFQQLTLTHFATFASGFVIALAAAFGIHLIQPKHQPLQVQQNPAQLRQLQKQNKALCTQLKLHRIPPPRGIVCK